MKFQVQGELDIPKEVSELLTGFTFTGQFQPFADIEMRLGQDALDRLSVILNLIYATQDLEEVKKYLFIVMNGRGEQQVRVTAPAQSISTMNTRSPGYTYNYNSESEKVVTPSLSVTDMQLKDVTEKKQPKQSIANLSRKMKNRVG